MSYRQAVRFVLIVVIGLIISMPVSAEDTSPLPKLKQRWELDITYQPLKIFTFTDPAGANSYYWFFKYTLTNNTKESIKLNLDVCLKADIRLKTDEKLSGYFPQLASRFYQDSIYPVVERELISAEEKLAGFPAAMREDTIIKYKKGLRYMNCKDLREKREILAGEKIEAMAIFTDVDARADQVELFIGGLFDVVKSSYRKEDKQFTQEYESKILRLVFSCQGDEFSKQFASPQLESKEWIVNTYGPIGDKNTVDNLIKGLADENPAARWIAWWLLRRMTDKTLEYNPDLDAEANKDSIENWKEWWYCTKEKLEYNQNLNKFEPKPAPTAEPETK
ncbi:MAG: hypothetical protein WC980_01365 [Candidatus Brocadiia bacterium]